MASVSHGAWDTDRPSISRIRRRRRRSSHRIARRRAAEERADTLFVGERRQSRRLPGAIRSER